uniref:Uncharacterized protein n=1 Tax=Ursus americanus TaxID=9643 RepID=A0A452SSS9_URSAM
MVPEAERLKGGWRQVEGASLGLFCPNTVKARDRSTGPWTYSLKSKSESFPIL